MDLWKPIEEENIIWRWAPTNKKRYEDIALEYAIEKCEDAESGIIVWGLYKDGWHPNPWNTRPIIKELIRRLKE